MTLIASGVATDVTILAKGIWYSMGGGSGAYVYCSGGRNSLKQWRVIFAYPPMRIFGAERPAQGVARALNTCVRWNTNGQY